MILTGKEIKEGKDSYFKLMLNKCIEYDIENIGALSVGGYTEKENEELNTIEGIHKYYDNKTQDEIVKIYEEYYGEDSILYKNYLNFIKIPLENQKILEEKKWKAYKKYEQGKGQLEIICSDCMQLSEEEIKKFGEDTEEDYILELEPEEYTYGLKCEKCGKPIIK